MTARSSSADRAAIRPIAAPTQALLPLIATLAAIAAASWVRLQFAGVPLERDEGEYAYAGQLILQGIPPYRLAYNMKFPGTYYSYAAILAIFGQSVQAIRVGVTIVNAATAVLLFFAGKRLLPTWAAAIAAATFAALSAGAAPLAVFGHATHFVLLPAIGGLLVLLIAIDRARPEWFLFAGVLFGIAGLMKQPGFAYVPFAVFVVAWTQRRLARPPVAWRSIAVTAAILLGGVALPFVLLCALFAAHGVLDRFWFWTFDYAALYVSLMTTRGAIELFGLAWGVVTVRSLPIWIAAGAGLFMLWLGRARLDARVIVTALLIASFAAFTAGFYFRPHYFILLFPVVGLLVGALGVALERLAATAMPVRYARLGVVVASVALLAGVVAGERAIWGRDPREISRAIYQLNPFPEAIDIAAYIASHSSPDDRIAVVGSEPEIYFYAHRKSATGYIYTYPLMEAQPFAARMQDEMIAEIDAAHPAYVVVVWIDTSWGWTPASNRRILDWAQRYTRACYTLVGSADLSAQGTTMRWDDEARATPTQSERTIFTFRRRSDEACTVPR
jgi:hypothetical protein